MVWGCIATPRCRLRRLPSDGWWPLAVTGGIIQSDVGSCREQTCLDIYIYVVKTYPSIDPVVAPPDIINILMSSLYSRA